MDALYNSNRNNKEEMDPDSRFNTSYQDNQDARGSLANGMRRPSYDKDQN